MRCRLLLLVGASLAVSPRAAADDPEPNFSQAEFFEKRVRPVLVDNCVSCHGPE